MSEEPKLWPTEDEVVFNSLNLVKAEAQKKVHPLSSGIFGVNGLNIFSQHSSSQNLVQSSTFAQAINNGENAIEDSEDWIKNLSEQKSKSGYELVAESVLQSSDDWINNLNQVSSNKDIFKQAVKNE